MVVDLEQMLCRDKNSEKMALVKVKAEDRRDLVRADDGFKNAGKYQFSLYLEQKDEQKVKINGEQFANETGAYGKLWSFKIKKKNKALPSPQEMFSGISQWLIAQTAKQLDGKNKKSQNHNILVFKRALDEIYDMMGFSNGGKTAMNESKGGELDLCDPYSKVTCFILFLHSMELGSPPLYSELNKVCRTMDLKHLETLGPFARCLDTIIEGAERQKNKIDQLTSGK